MVRATAGERARAHPGSTSALAARACVAVLVVARLAVPCSVARAQSSPADRVAELRARVDASADDVSLRCQLSFALVGAGRFEEARGEADRAISALGSPTERDARRTLGACLYNRGRAHEGLGRARDAAADYVESLRLRANEAVLARLTALVPGTPPELPAAALALLDRERPDDSAVLAARAPFPSVRSRALPGVTFRFVPLRVSLERGFTGLEVYVIVERDGGPAIVERVDLWSNEDENAEIEVSGARELHAAGADGATVRVHATGSGTCGSMDGVEDFDHDAILLVAFDPTARTLRAGALVTSQHDCASPIQASLRLQGDAVVVQRSRGGPLAAGTHPLSEVLRPIR